MTSLVDKCMWHRAIVQSIICFGICLPRLVSSKIPNRSRSPNCCDFVQKGMTKSTRNILAVHVHVTMPHKCWLQASEVYILCSNMYSLTSIVEFFVIENCCYMQCYIFFSYVDCNPWNKLMVTPWQPRESGTQPTTNNYTCYGFAHTNSSPLTIQDQLAVTFCSISALIHNWTFIA